MFTPPPVPQWTGRPENRQSRKPPAFLRFKEFSAGTDGSGRTLLSPEGSILTLRLASRNDRLLAFLFDAFVIVGLNIVIFALPMHLMRERTSFMFTVMAFMSFLVNNVYFTYFELAWQGTTPGKRAARLRVISRRGGALSPYAVVLRNLTRQLEILMPLLSLVLSEGVGASGPVFAVLWFFVVTLMPCWNRDRMRCGDILADTLVIQAPSPVLFADLAAHEPDRAERRWTFTKSQLSIYGDYELMVLEEILRKPLKPGHEGPLFNVAAKIASKIGVALPRDLDASQCRVFLKDFYAAERAALEEGRLYGVRKSDQLTPAARGEPRQAPSPGPTTPSERFRQGSWQD
jgi:uncharacterized RDD family membrane protein YckC